MGCSRSHPDDGAHVGLRELWRGGELMDDGGNTRKVCNFVSVMRVSGP